MTKPTHVLCVLTLSFILGVMAASVFSGCQQSQPIPNPHSDPVKPPRSEPVAQADAQTPPVTTESLPPGDWPQWGGTGHRNNIPTGSGIPLTWNVGAIDRKTNDWISDEAENIKWVARLGSQTYGTPVVSDGRVYVGTNNSAGYLQRYPSDVDLGCLLCFSESDGEFLWQHSSEKLPSGREHDWPLQGICCAPLVEGERLWFVSSRGHVVCLDTQGFRDGENDGPFVDEATSDADEADTVWTFDMMKELNVSQHNMCSCSVTALEDILFVSTSNGVDESHENLPSPEAPSFLAMNKTTGEVYWADASPGANILHGQWSSPAAAVLGGVPQVIFAGGDGWVYSFRADRGQDGRPTLLWKFDTNPKESKWVLGGRGTRNSIIATPVIYQEHVFVAVGQDPEHGEGVGHLWCIDPTKRGDVSPQCAFRVEGEKRVPLAARREQAVNPEDGEVAEDNPNSAALWHYSIVDQNNDGSIDFEEEMHRALGSVAVKNDLVFVADFSGLFHCVDAKTGKPHWTYDMLAQAWGSPLIVQEHVYIADEDGDIAVFKLSSDPEVAMKKVDDEFLPINAGEDEEVVNMENSVFSTPVVANNVLFIANKEHLFAIAESE